ncbi:MAG TPA: HAMP domain-containing sensor histidine kinase [Chloroflexota bacterium]|nr:HAMP domain-containing sensor histidine kinase [Chloroflexota bacterium]
MKFERFAGLRSGFLGRLWVRLLVVTVAPVLITVASVALLANYVTIGQFENFLAQDTQQRDARLVLTLDHFYQEQNSWTGAGSTVQRVAELTGERVVLADASGKVVADSGGQLVDQQQGRSWRRATSLEVGGSRVGTVFINPTLPGRANSLKADAFLAGVNRSLVIGSVVAVVVGLLLTIFLSNRLRRQLAGLIRVTREIGRGDFSLRVPTPEQGDLGDMGMAINRMAEDLERLVKARQQMVADVAHELRNPLQNINGYIEALRDGVLPADERTLGILSSETGVLRRLVDDLQDLSMADSGRLRVELKTLPVQAQIAAVLDSMRPRADELGLELIGHALDGLPDVEADERRLRQVIANLVQNAFAHTPAGGRVVASAKRQPQSVEIAVSDTGRGVAPEDQERIFERFVRVDPARTRATGGAGLGLTIARELVHAMRGEIGVSSRPGEGARFWIRLPQAVPTVRRRRRPAAAAPVAVRA